MNFITNGSMSLMAPFYPDKAAEKGVDVLWVGFVFGILNIGAFLSSLVFGKMMNIWGRKLVLSLGIISIAVTTLTYGLLDYVDNP